MGKISQQFTDLRTNIMPNGIFGRTRPVYLNLLAGCLALVVTSCSRADDVIDGDGHAVITIYHHVDSSTPPSTSLSEEQFREHMAYLRDNNFEVWPLDRLIQALKERSPIPERTAVVTFDDGYISIYETAFPIMEEMGFPWTLFVSTEPIDNNQRGYMNWDQVRELSEAGVIIANHMVTHPHMIDPLPGETESERIERLRDELLSAERRIEQETGQSHRMVAYPYGEFDQAVTTMVEEEGFIGLAQNSGAVGYYSDMLALPRFPLAGIYASMNSVPTKLNSMAFRIERQEPWSPITDSTRPAVTLQLNGNFNPAQLACYAGNGTLEIEWLDREQGVFRIQPEREFQSRRFGYNCTAPRTGSNRFYWFNKFWTRSTIDNQD